MYAHTLEMARQDMVPHDIPGTWMQPVQKGDKHFVTAALDAHTEVNTNFDAFAPGIREQNLAPPAPSFGPYRSSLYSNQRRNNAAAIFDWDGNDVGPPERNNIFLSKQNQRLGAYWHKVLVTDADRLRIENIDNGTWSVPYTGFTAFSKLRPTSTKRFI